MKIKQLFNFFIALVLAIGSFVTLPARPAYALTLTVTNTNDSGAGSLRQALATASDGDTIDLTGISGTITLTSFELSVSDNITIIGPGPANLTISGNNLLRVFFISTGKTVSISGVTVSNGYTTGDGGGILSQGILTLDNVVISNNAAVSDGGGIYSYSGTSLTVTNSQINNNSAATAGGGLRFDGTSINLDNTTIDNNQATGTGGGNFGGGVYIDANVTTAFFDEVAITNNSSTVGGGGLASNSSLTIFNSLVANNFTVGSFTYGQGGGLYLSGTGKTYTLANVTISGNTADNINNIAYGGGIHNTQALNLYNVTITGNTSEGHGGGLYGNANSINSIIDSNTSTNETSEDCAGTLNSSQGHNLIQITTGCTITGTTTGNITNTDPLLNPLADNGGPTMTHSLQSGSPAIDAGYSGDECPGLDQRGIIRPQDGNLDDIITCDMGAFEYAIFPIVLSITRAETNPTAAASLDFTVTFSKPVNGVDTSDFALSANVIGASITSVVGSDAFYTVTVNSGSGNGTIRLDLADDNSIKDSLNNPLGGMSTGDGNFTSGEEYTINKTLTFKSSGAQDGWILESTETSGNGGTMNSIASTLNLGDDSAKKQYRSILSFDTSSLPDNAVITKVTLKLKRQGVAGGGNPVAMFQGFMVDIKKGTFGTAPLALADFKTTANKTVGPQSSALTAGWYNLNLTPAKAYVNGLATNSGQTQMRLRFKLDDNNNTVANILKLYSGNAGAANRPQLVIEYYVP